jgi:flagellar basal-body rod modification protein FlgD
MVDATSTIASPAPPSRADPSHGLPGLGSDDFLRLLITQLRNQDPLEPVGNEELLQQIASVREIELSTTLADSLRVLTGEQRFGSASALIGQFVTSVADENGVAQSGLVEGIRFDDQGRPILRLSNGSELPLDQLARVEPPVRAAELLIGSAVGGVDRRKSAGPEVVEGVVTGVQVDAAGEVVLELDTGANLRFRDVIMVTPAETH